MAESIFPQKVKALRSCHHKNAKQKCEEKEEEVSNFKTKKNQTHKKLNHLLRDRSYISKETIEEE